MTDLTKKIRQFVQPRAVNVAQDVSGGAYGPSWQNELDAKRHLVGGALIRRDHPLLGPALVNSHEGLDYLKDIVGLPSTDPDYLMDKHNNELARMISEEQIKDTSGKSRKRTEKEMMEHIDRLLKESREKSYWKTGKSPDGQMYPMWLDEWMPTQ
jgi:hypothetical protein